MSLFCFVLIFQASNLLYVDQPTGTGFSYSSDKRDIRHNEDGVSDDLYDFLQVQFLTMSVCNPKNQQVSTIFWVIYGVCACTVVNEFQILSKRGQLIILIMLCWYDGLIVLNSLCSFV